MQEQPKRMGKLVDAKIENGHIVGKIKLTRAGKKLMKEVKDAGIEVEYRANFKIREAKEGEHVADLYEIKEKDGRVIITK